MAKKRDQLHMAELWNPSRRSVKALRLRRNANGFVERSHWIPEEYADEFKDYARKLRERSGRDMD